jgi:hypothetical protein
MPITAVCPGCKQTLSVPDQYAGMQGKCPTCGTDVLFAAAALPIIPVAPTPAPATPDVPPGVPPAFATTVPQAPAAPFTLAGLDPRASIFLPVGLFFLLLLAIATCLPWRGGTGIRWANATLLLMECLLVGATVGSTFYFKDNLRLNALIGAAFGTFAFFVMIGEISRFRGGEAGLWIGLLSALGILAPFIVLAVLRPLDWAYMKTINMPPVFQHYGALVASQAVAFLFGFLYLLLTLAA